MAHLCARAFFRCAILCGTFRVRCVIFFARALPGNIVEMYGSLWGKSVCGNSGVVFRSSKFCCGIVLYCLITYVIMFNLCTNFVECIHLFFFFILKLSGRNVNEFDFALFVWDWLNSSYIFSYNISIPWKLLPYGKYLNYRHLKYTQKETIMRMNYYFF